MDSLIENLSTIFNEKVVYQKLADNIITLASKKDGYQYIYHSKIIQKKLIAFFYWYNIHIELDKHSKKYENVFKQRNTDLRIYHYKCGEYIMIKVYHKNGLIFFKLNHILHSYSNYIKITNSIKQYINSNIK